MIRFVYPEKEADMPAKARDIIRQIEAFRDSEPVKELFSLLDTDCESIGRKYNGRRSVNGGVIETQELAPVDVLESKRERLYPLFRELGFIDINSPRKSENSRVIVLGGALGACLDRTECAARCIDDITRSVDGLTCYRPINPVERKYPGMSGADTEFGAMSEDFVKVFGLQDCDVRDDFTGNRNLNSISCVREYEKEASRVQYRIFAAPSEDPGTRRADTGDSLVFYLKHNKWIDADESLLFITNNRYCNRQFLQLAYHLLLQGCPARMDIAGCFGDDRIIGVDEYDPFQYLQDLIGIIDWGGRFSALSDKLWK